MTSAGRQLGLCFSALVALLLSSAASAESQLYRVALRKLPLRRVGLLTGGGGGGGLSAAATAKEFYVGRVIVGHPEPQELRVVFDTGSGQVLLPSTRCQSAACLEHAKYDPGTSATAQDVDLDDNGTLVQGVSGHDRPSMVVGLGSDLGDGEVEGHIIFDRFCLSSDGRSRLCADMGLVAATTMTDLPFRAMPHDGVVGLGLEGLAVNPAFNFLGRLAGDGESAAPADLRQFSLFLGSQSGELTFGGYDEKRLASPLEWAPVVEPDAGYWQVEIRGIRVGNTTLSACQDVSCRGIIDNGASQIGVPAAFGRELLAALGDHSCTGGPDLHIDLGSDDAPGPTLTLRPEDYAGGGPTCSGPQISELDLPDELLNTILLGEPILRRYYSVFDWGSSRVGFGIARPETAAEADAGAAAAEAEAAATPWTHARLQAAEEVSDLLELSMHMLMRALALQIIVGALFAASRLNGLSLQQLLSGRVLDSFAGLTPVPAAEVPPADDCAICLGSCEDDDCEGASEDPSKRLAWRRLRCKHQFHEECIHQWLRKSQLCPVCRSPTQTTGLRKPLSSPTAPAIAPLMHRPV